MNRLVLVLALLLAAAFAAYQTIGSDSLYWKRRVLLAVMSPAKLPTAYYEPSQLIEGATDGQAIPRVDPEQEQLGRSSLDLAAQYADDNDAQALIVGRHGHIVYERYWRGASADKPIEAGAFNATLTALAFGLATADRKIALTSEPVANYIESFREPRRSTITLDHLLRMSSGLGPNVDDPGSGAMSTREQLVRDIRTECLEREPVAAPGKRWQVQPCDPQLLAHIIERATGEAYATYLSKSLWKPIGASDAQLMLDHEGGTAHAACCLRTRLDDWLRIGQLLANDGKFEGEQVLPPGWVRTMTTPANPTIPFGSQVWLGTPFTEGGGTTEPYVADDLFYLRGHGPTRLWIVPSMSLVILHVGTSDAAGPAWDDSRIPNLVIRGASDYVPKAPKPGAQDIKNLVPNH